MISRVPPRVKYGLFNTEASLTITQHRHVVSLASLSGRSEKSSSRGGRFGCNQLLRFFRVNKRISSVIGWRGGSGGKVGDKVSMKGDERISWCNCRLQEELHVNSWCKKQLYLSYIYGSLPQTSLRALDCHNYSIERYIFQFHFSWFIGERNQNLH